MLRYEVLYFPHTGVFNMDEYGDSQPDESSHLVMRVDLNKAVPTPVWDLDEDSDNGFSEYVGESGCELTNRLLELDGVDAVMVCAHCVSVVRSKTATRMDVLSEKVIEIINRYFHELHNIQTVSDAERIVDESSISRADTSYRMRRREQTFRNHRKHYKTLAESFRKFLDDPKIDKDGKVTITLPSSRDLVAILATVEYALQRSTPDDPECQLSHYEP